MDTTDIGITQFLKQDPRFREKNIMRKAILALGVLGRSINTELEFLPIAEWIVYNERLEYKFERMLVTGRVQFIRGSHRSFSGDVRAVFDTVEREDRIHPISIVQLWIKVDREHAIHKAVVTFNEEDEQLTVHKQSPVRQRALPPKRISFK